MLAMPMDRNEYPTWYSSFRFLLPFGLAVLASAWIGLTITGIIAAPNLLQWAPTLYASLEGFASFATLSLAMGAVGSMVGLATSYLARIPLLPYSESLNTILKFENKSLKEANEALEARMRQVINDLNKNGEAVAQRLPVEPDPLLIGRNPVAGAPEPQLQLQLQPQPLNPQEGAAPKLH